MVLYIWQNWKELHIWQGSTTVIWFVALVRGLKSRDHNLYMFQCPSKVLGNSSQPDGPCNTSCVRSNDKNCWTNIDKCNSRLWHFSRQPHPFPHSPKVGLVQIDVLNSKNEEKCSGHPSQFGTCPNTTTTRTHKHKNTGNTLHKKEKYNWCNQRNTFHQPSFTIWQLYLPLKIDTHTTHVHCSHIHPHLPHSQHHLHLWEVVACFIHDSYPWEELPNENNIFEVGGTGTINAKASWLGMGRRKCKSEDCQDLQLMRIFRIGGAHI